ncbi:hypothetical protein ScPMuIL_004127 [Solemya velum]
MDGEFKLETIFDVCDENNQGYITIDRFKTLAKEHFGTNDSEDIDSLLHILDPENKGRIGFTEFCRGVQSILELPSQVQRKASFGGSLNDVSALLDLSPELSENNHLDRESNPEFSYQEYTTDEDASVLITDYQNEAITDYQPESNGKSLLQPVYADDVSVKSSENSRPEYTDEESYEDYGQADDFETDISDQYSLAHTKLKNRKRSSAAHARRIQKSPSPQTLDDIDGEFQKLTQKIQYLESHLHQLTDERSSTENFQKKIKDENSLLMSRVHYLEEQVRESEDKHNQELRKYTEEMHRQERNKATQIDYLNERLQSMEGEYNDAKSEIPRLKGEVYRLKMEKMELQERLGGVQQDYETLRVEHEEMLRKHQCEQQNTDLLLDELGKELEELRRYKLQQPPVKRHSDIDIQSEVVRLKEALWTDWKNMQQENKSLQEKNMQLLNQCYEEGRNLVEESQAKSLASELQTLTKEELVNALKDQEEVNQQLRMYIDKMILSILEKNPSLLEVR